MPTLNWIGKEAVVNHHLQVPFHLLKDVPSLACGEPGNGKEAVVSLLKNFSVLNSLTACLK
jgi:hypothetical protein